LFCVLAALAACAPPPSSWAVWPTPPGWRREVIRFPLDFAPSVSHRGVEEIRFPPGFFDPKAPLWWSYVFAWAIDDAATLDRATLERDLTAYFRGLATAVKKNGGFDPARFRTQLDGDGPWRGTIDSYDPFKTLQPLTLHVLVEEQRCAGARRLMIVTASPRPADDPAWHTLADVRATLRCQ
jgi:hypothetical protein